MQLSNPNRWGVRLSAFVVMLLLVAALAVIVLRPEFLTDNLPAKWRIELLAWRHGVAVDHGQRMTMSDGTVLTASLYLPDGAQGKLPTILLRLPYHRFHYPEGYNNGVFFARRGYAVVVQDLRGTGDSGGELLPWQHASEDSVSTLDWIGRQPWSDGKVGTLGCSALGEVQLVSQHTASPAWRAMIPLGAGGAVGSLANRHGYFGLYEGGVFQLASGFSWFAAYGTLRPDAPRAKNFDRKSLLRELPISELVARVRPAPNGYKTILTTPLGDPGWSKLGYLGDESRLRVPALIVNTWGDQTLQDTLAIAEHWRQADPEGTARRQKVIIAAGNHCGHIGVGESGKFGDLKVINAGQPYQKLFLRWFDYWLRGKGNALEEFPAYTYYVIGADMWRHAESWPPAEAQTMRWYLGSDGRANSLMGTGRLTPQKSELGAAFDAWRYDPGDPVPSRGGPICCTGSVFDQAGPRDQSDVEARDDVLVYTSPAMTADMWIAGPIKARLTISSDAYDTDLVARLVHVWPDDRTTSIQEGALRLRYRNNRFASPQLLTPGEPVRVSVDMRSIAYRLPKGHRLRFDLTSSSFPRLERNLNTGGDNAVETRMVVAKNTVHYDRDDGSWLELSVLPESLFNSD